MAKLHDTTLQALKESKPKKAGNQASMAEYDGYVAAITKEKPGFLEPGNNETTRGIALSLHRAAKRAKRTIQTATGEQNGAKGVFFVEIDPPAPKAPKAAKPAAPEAPATPGKPATK